MKIILLLVLAAIFVIACLSLDAETTAQDSLHECTEKLREAKNEGIIPQRTLHDCFSNITLSDPSNKDAWNGRIESAKILGDKDEINYSRAYYYSLFNNEDNLILALKYINNFTSKKPDSPEGWRLKGDIENKFDDYRKLEANYYWAKYWNKTYPKENYARENITRFLQANKSFNDAWILGTGIFNQSSEDRYKAMAFYCSAYYYLNGLDDPLKYIDKSLKIDSNYSETWCLKGMIPNKTNSTNESIGAFINAIRSNESFFDINLSKSEAFLNLGKIYQNEPNDQEANYCFANGFFLGDKPKEAVEYLQKFITLDEFNSSAWKLQGDVLSEMGNKSLYAKANYSFAFSEFLNNRNDEAKKFLDRITDKPNYIEINNLMGMIYERKGDYESAFKSFNKSINTNNESLFNKNKSLSKILMNLGRMELMKNENFTNALEYFNQSLKKDPSNYEAWTNRGVALFNLGKYEEASNIFGCSFSANKYKPDKGEDYWNKIAEIMASKRWYNSSNMSLSNFNKSKSIRTNYNKGFAKVNLGKFDEAYFDEAISDLGKATLNPYDIKSNRDRKIVADAWMNRAIANTSLHRFDDALEDIANSIEINGSMADAWYIKGLILLSLERPAEANMSFSRAFELDNLSLKSKSGFGQSLFKNGQYHAALEFFSQCLIDDNNNEEVWINRGIVENALNRRGDSLISFGEALKALKHKRAKIWCDIGYAWYWLAKTQNSSAQRLLAQWGVTNPADAFNRSIIFDPDFSGSYYNNSIIMYESKNYNESLKSIENAVKIDPTYKNSSEFYYHRSLIYSNLSRPDECSSDLTRSYQRNNFNLKTIYFITKLYNSNEILINELMKKAIEPHKNLYPVSNSDIDVRSTIGDIEFLLNELNKTNQTESRILDYMAHVKYDMSTNCSLGFISNREMVNEALEGYIDSRKLAPNEGIDVLFQAILLYANIVSLLLGFIYIFLIKIDRLRVSKLYILIAVNIIGLTLLSKIFSDYFDTSKAFWSQLIQFALFILFIVSLKLTRYLNIKYLSGLKNAIEQQNPTYININSIYDMFIIIIISYLINYIHIFSLLARIQIITILILGYLIIITSIPLYKLISSKNAGINDRDLRNIYAIVQFFYLTLFAVPLSWFFWLIGIPRDLSVKIPLEDQILYIPLYSLSLLALFSILLIYPYCIKYLLGSNSPSDSVNVSIENKESLKKIDNGPDKVWKGFIACIIGPIITLLLSLIAPMLLVPMDQTGLANLIIAAIAPPNLGV